MQNNITYREKDKGIQFIISYKDATGKWKQKSKQGFKSKKEAKAAADETLDKLKKEVIEYEDLNEEYKGITFAEFKDMYLEHEKLYREENTIEIKQYAFKKFKTLNKLKLEDIKNIHIQKCIDTMVKDELSLQTIKNYLSMLKALFNSAIDEFSVLKISPVRKIKLPELKVKTEKRALTKSEFEDLISKIENYKLYVITLIAGSCGLRIGEILGLTLSDFDDINMTLTIRQQFKRVGLKAKHGVGTLKTANSYRQVPISAKMCEALLKYIDKYPKNIDGRIFNLTNTSSLGSRLSSLYNSLGYDISIHELRHTYATLLVSNNRDLKTVAKLMGHSVEQTIKTYSHVTDEMMEKAAQTIRDIF
ncbi:MAG: tyrosine-type recombinase/integrase [Clostridium sp.]|uniref:tyrosine-type recombinase/integrase n=1 Tax=Clostridium sp. TaxID=1506 RepID=UPI003D6D5E70